MLNLKRVITYYSTSISKQIFSSSLITEFLSQSKILLFLQLALKFKDSLLLPTPSEKRERKILNPSQALRPLFYVMSRVIGKFGILSYFYNIKNSLCQINGPYILIKACLRRYTKKLVRFPFSLKKIFQICICKIND